MGNCKQNGAAQLQHIKENKGLVAFKIQIQKNFIFPQNSGK